MGCLSPVYEVKGFTYTKFTYFQQRDLVLSLVSLQSPDPAAVRALVHPSCPLSLWAASENSNDEMEVFVPFSGGTYPARFLTRGSAYLTIYKFM